MAHLTCDDLAHVDTFIMEMDGNEVLEVPGVKDPGNPEVSHAWIDITGIDSGDHTVRLCGKNKWGRGPWSVPLDFTKQLPGVPSGVGLRFE